MKKKTYQSVDSNNPHDRPLNIHELAQSAAEKHLAESYVQLEKKAIGLSETIQKLLKEIESREDEITHLKQLLTSFSSQPSLTGLVTVNPISDEELIADIQLRKLKEKAKISELTLDETRRYDLFVKNKRLAQGDATTISGNKVESNSPNKSKLLELASKKMKSEEK